MAKTKDAYQQFLAEVLESVPTDDRKSLEETLSNERIASVMKDRVMARSDYSRSKDELSAQQRQFESEVQEARKRIEGWTEWYTEAVNKEATTKQALDAYKRQFGDLDGNGNHNVKYTTPEDVTKTLTDTMRERDAAAIRFADVLTDLKIDYRTEFGKKLDTSALIEYAGKHGLPLDAAFDRFTAADRETKREKDFETRLAEAKKEGAKEALSQHKLPQMSGPVEPHVLDIQEGVARTSKDRVAAAVADWNTSEHSGVF